MKTHFGPKFVPAVILFLGLTVGGMFARFDWPTAQAASAGAQVARYGSVIGLKPQMKEEYARLHAACWPEVLAMLKKCNIRNYSIYLAELDGKLYLFSYFEYTGSDIEKDTARMKADPKTRQWWTHTDPCQIRLSGTKQGDQWKGIPEVFHME
jgi:L-rhamnose mutarotase